MRWPPCVEPGCGESASGPNGRCRKHYLAHRYATNDTVRKRNRESALRRASQTPNFARITTWGRHNLTPESGEALLRSQGGRCPICSNTPLRWAIDHDHACCPGKFSCGRCIRGLLCVGCNGAVGTIGDDAASAMRLVEYLRKPHHAASAR